MADLTKIKKIMWRIKFEWVNYWPGIKCYPSINWINILVKVASKMLKPFELKWEPVFLSLRWQKKTEKITNKIVIPNDQKQ